MLIPLFFAFFIEFHREEKIIESGTSKKLNERAFLLDNEIYMSTSQVVKRKSYTFWAFVHSEKIIQKSDYITS